VSALSLYLTGGPGTFVPGPVFSSVLPCYRGLPFEHKKLVPEANAPSHGWLVTEKIGRDGWEESRGQLEQQDWGLGQRLPKNAAPVFTGFARRTTS
jgi:hypothetical protein